MISFIPSWTRIKETNIEENFKVIKTLEWNESDNEKRICIAYNALFTDFEVVISLPPGFRFSR